MRQLGNNVALGRYPPFGNRVAALRDHTRGMALRGDAIQFVDAEGVTYGADGTFPTLAAGRTVGDIYFIASGSDQSGRGNNTLTFSNDYEREQIISLTAGQYLHYAGYGAILSGTDFPNVNTSDTTYSSTMAIFRNCEFDSEDFSGSFSSSGGVVTMAAFDTASNVPRMGVLYFTCEGVHTVSENSVTIDAIYERQDTNGDSTSYFRVFYLPPGISLPAQVFNLSNLVSGGITGRGGWFTVREL